MCALRRALFRQATRESSRTQRIHVYSWRLRATAMAPHQPPAAEQAAAAAAHAAQALREVDGAVRALHAVHVRTSVQLPPLIAHLHRRRRCRRRRYPLRSLLLQHGRRAFSLAVRAVRRGRRVKAALAARFQGSVGGRSGAATSVASSWTRRSCTYFHSPHSLPFVRGSR